jgi:hypothetical protein
VFSLFVEKYAQRDDRVIVELAPVEEQSLIVLTHEFSLRNPTARSRLERGWARVLDVLVALCSEGGVVTKRPTRTPRRTVTRSVARSMG